MKIIILILLYLIVPNSFAQKEIMTSNGQIHFEASVPLFEEVAAVNKTVSCILYINTGVIKSDLVMKDFRFKLALMEEHFNDKYLETDKYPKATFKGKIQDFNLNIIGTTPKEFKLSGELKMHGKSKKINTIITMKKVEKGLEIITTIKVKPSDFKIEIPEMLSVKVAEIVTIKSNFFLQ